MLPFSPYPILSIIFNTMLDASAERIFFFYLSPLAGFSFLDKFLLQDFFWGGRGKGFAPHLRLFLIVRPLVLKKSRSPSRPRLRI